MIKAFDNIKVRSHHSPNWYDSFRVDTDRNIVSFVQRDARRNGQVARRMTITVLSDDTYIIEALSADGGRYESFNSTQCLKLALSLLDEAHSEARQMSNVKNVKPTKPAEDAITIIGVSFIILTILPVVCTINLSYEEYLKVLRTCAILVGAFLSIYFLVESYNYRKEYERKSK